MCAQHLPIPASAVAPKERLKRLPSAKPRRQGGPTPLTELHRASRWRNVARLRIASLFRRSCIAIFYGVMKKIWLVLYTVGMSPLLSAIVVGFAAAMSVVFRRAIIQDQFIELHCRL